MDESQRALADRVKRARKAKRYTQKQLAEAAGVSLGVVNNFERYETFPQPSNLRHILQVVGLEEEVTAEQVAEITGDGQQQFEQCPTCLRVTWPDTYELMFDILGAFMDTMDRSERKAFQRWVTKPVREKYRPWLHD